MRLELNLSLFIVLLLIFLSFLLIFIKQNGTKITTKIVLLLSFSLLSPAFIPGHGELIVVLPNGALFAKFTNLTLGAGLFFIFIYSLSLLLLLRLLKLK